MTEWPISESAQLGSSPDLRWREIAIAIESDEERTKQSSDITNI